MLGDPERGGQWLDEQGRAVADGVRDLVEVGLRDAHPFGHRAVVVEDAQNGPVRAVLGTAGVAGVATPAGVVDLGRHPASVGRFADELVAEHPSESHVTAHQLQVGLADAGGADLEHDVARARLGRRQVAAEADRRAVAVDPSHHECGPRADPSLGENFT